MDVEYDEEDNLIETEGEQVKMEEVSELKYLGFIISENASKAMWQILLA